MRWSATKLRWMLLTGALLLAGLVAGTFSLARYRAGKIWQRILARNGINLQRDTNGFTYSQSSGGHTVFTLHASKATPEGKDKWALHDAVLILYGHGAGHEDRIYGREFEYDQSQGVARAIGEVHMDLQAPEPAGRSGTAGFRPELGFGPDKDAVVDPRMIHVRTSGLVYIRKLGIAATGEPTEFRYGGMTCVSRGAEFDTGPSVVRLLADVRMSGTVRQAAFTLTAAHAELDREANTADLTAALITAGDRRAEAGHALLHLHKDGTLASADATGGVATRAGTQSIASPQAAAVFGAENRPQSTRWFTGVQFSDADRSRPAHGTAATLNLVWTPSGALGAATAEGNVRYASHGSAKDGSAVSRDVRAAQVDATFAPDEGTGAKRSRLRQVHMAGGAEMHSASSNAASKGPAASTDVSGDDLTAAFRTDESGEAKVQQLHGAGHTRLEQIAADGKRQQSRGDTLDVVFTPGSGEKDSRPQVASAVQTGGVEVQSWGAPKIAPAPSTAASGEGEVSTGRAAKAVFAAAEGTLTLGGSPTEPATVEQKAGVLHGAQIVLHQDTGDTEASGGVVATEWGESGGRTGSPATPATHVQASRARLLHAAGLSEFFGEPEHPAQLWQGGSQVRAAEITLDGKTKAVTATPGSGGGLVDAVFAGAESKAKRADPSRPSKSEPEGRRVGAGSGTEEGATEAGRNAVRVSAARMDYDDAHHEAVFTGAVHMRGVMGEATAERGNAFLRASAVAEPGAQGKSAQPSLSGTLDRMVLLGSVRLREPGRTGAGEQLTYTAATDSFVLTGTDAKPPRVTGEQGSVVTGATLLFRSGESTIVVAGAKGSPRVAGPARVHTETDLKP